MPDLPGSTTSVWIATVPDTPRHGAPASSTATVDVAVVGGGIAGMTTALFCARAGLSVLVLEADRVGHGATGNSTVKVTAAHGVRAGDIASKHDGDVARTYVEANRWGMEEVVRLVGQLAIDCDLQRVAHCVYATSEDELGQIDAEADVERAAGLAVERVDELDLPFAISGAIRTADQAQFHPTRYVLGLAAGVEGEGGRVAEGVRVTDIDADGERQVVRFEGSGEVAARDVVIATRAPILEHGLYATRYEPHMEYAVAVRTRGSVPSDSYISAGQPTRSVRWVDHDGERLMIVVGEGHKVGEHDQEDPDGPYRRLVSWADEHWGVDAVPFRWSTHDAVPYDGLPMIGRMEGTDHRYVLTGFGTWGMTNATMGAAIVRDAVLGVEHEWASTFAPSEHRFKGGLTKAVKENVKAAAHLVGDRLRPKAQDLAAIEPGSGDLVRVDGKTLAVHRDDEGALHAVDATCTHMGCLVEWNGAETSWDCPCHGSRFAVDGDVISAPASRPLERVDLDAED